jgi:hypothetical protein
MRFARAFAALILLVTLAPAQAATERSRASAPTEGCVQKEWGYRCFYGPYTASYDPEEEHDGYSFIEAPPEAGYITSSYATLVDEQGNAVGRHEAHLHHVVFANPNKDNLMCGNFPADFFFGSGKERTKMVMPEGYGYYWDNESPGYGYPPTWAMAHHLMTMHEGHEVDVFVRLDLEFQPVAEGPLVDVKPVWLDVMGCNIDPVFDVLKGSGKGGVFRKSDELTIPEGGRFVALGGHLHDGGLKLRLDNETSGEKVWVSRATYGKANGGWDLRQMSAYSGLPGPHVSAGDQLELTAYYDSTHRWRKVMGIMVGALAPDIEQDARSVPTSAGRVKALYGLR